MKRAIWKWEIPRDKMDLFECQMPEGAQILTCQVQNGGPVVWALVNPNARLTKMRLRILGTGHQHSDMADWTYVSTFQLLDGAFVGHLFVKGDKL